VLAHGHLLVVASARCPWSDARTLCCPARQVSYCLPRHACTQLCTTPGNLHVTALNPRARAHCSLRAAFSLKLLHHRVIAAQEQQRNKKNSVFINLHRRQNFLCRLKSAQKCTDIRQFWRIFCSSSGQTMICHRFRHRKR